MQKRQETYFYQSAFKKEKVILHQWIRFEVFFVDLLLEKKEVALNADPGVFAVFGVISQAQLLDCQVISSIGNASQMREDG